MPSRLSAQLHEIRLDLHAQFVEPRKAVEAPLRRFVQKRRAAALLCVANIVARIPVQMLAQHAQPNAQIGQQLAGPSPGGNDELRRRIAPFVGLDGHARRVGSPARDALADSQLGS